MSRSLLSLRDVRQIFRLLGECVELGADPILWRQHLAEQSWLLVCGHFVNVAELNAGRSAVTRRRCEVVPDATWYRSTFFQEYLRPLGLYDQVTSVDLAAPHAVSAICWLNCEKRRCTRRASRLLSLLHDELTRLKHAGKLAPLGGFSLTNLSRRQREALFGIFQGDSEKQLARRLGISVHTVHDYLKALHRRLGASSRGELMNRCLKFWPALERLQGGAADDD